MAVTYNGMAFNVQIMSILSYIIVIYGRDNLRALIRDSNNISIRSDNLDQLEEWMEVLNINLSY